jgi:hypothetical protein
MSEVFWPAMTRCPDCGRFMKRGILNWMEHIYGDCPHAEYYRAFRDRLVAIGKKHFKK